MLVTVHHVVPYVLLEVNKLFVCARFPPDEDPPSRGPKRVRVGDMQLRTFVVVDKCVHVIIEHVSYYSYKH
jgi:hypothetical protein